MGEFDVRPNDPSLPYGALSRRQPAEGAAREVVPDRAAAAAARRADAGRRRRRAPADLRADPRRRRGARHGVVCASSDYEQLAAICDRVIVFGRGRVVPRARRRRAHEGADRRAVLRRDGRRGCRESSHDRGDRGDRAARRRRRPTHRRSSGRRRARALRAAARLGADVRRLRDPAADTFLTTSNFTTIFGSQAILVVLTLALLIAADRRRLRPLGRGDADARRRWCSRSSTSHHGWSIWASIVAALGVGVVRRADQRRARRRSRHRLADRRRSAPARSSPASCSGSATRRRSAACRDGLIDWVVVKRLFGIPLEFYYGIALCVILWYVFEYTPVGRRLLFVGRGRSVARLSGIRVVAPALGRARRVRRDQRRSPASSTPARSAPPTRPRGSSFLLPAFAAAFLGATSDLRPGASTRSGSFVGRLLPRHRHHRAPAARRADVRAEALLRRRADPGRGAVAGRPPPRRAPDRLIAIDPASGRGRDPRAGPPRRARRDRRLATRLLAGVGRRAGATSSSGCARRGSRCGATRSATSGAGSREPSPAPSIASGSHIDSQTPGGRYDGALGDRRRGRGGAGAEGAGRPAAAHARGRLAVRGGGARASSSAGFWGSRAITGEIAASTSTRCATTTASRSARRWRRSGSTRSGSPRRGATTSTRSSNCTSSRARGSRTRAPGRRRHRDHRHPPLRRRARRPFRPCRGPADDRPARPDAGHGGDRAGRDRRTRSSWARRR